MNNDLFRAVILGLLINCSTRDEEQKMANQ
jgi:hypothetical protein